MSNENEKKVSFYDPTAEAFREITISQARKLIESAKEVEKLLAEKEI